MDKGQKDFVKTGILVIIGGFAMFALMMILSGCATAQQAEPQQIIPQQNEVSAPETKKPAPVEKQEQAKYVPDVKQKSFFIPAFDNPKAMKEGAEPEGFYFVIFRDVNIPGEEDANRNVGFFITDKDGKILLQAIKPGYQFKKN